MMIELANKYHKFTMDLDTGECFGDVPNEDTDIIVGDFRTKYTIENHKNPDICELIDINNIKSAKVDRLMVEPSPPIDYVFAWVYTRSSR